MERRDGVGFITIDRRERLNSLDVETARDLRKAGLQVARDEDVRAIGAIAATRSAQVPSRSTA